MEKRIIYKIPSIELPLKKIIEFVQLNNLFKSEVYFLKNNQRFNAKSIITLSGLLYTSKKGEEIGIYVKGDTAENDINKILNFLKGNE